MLQRLQTIYIIIVLGLLFGFLYMPIAEFSYANTQVYVLKLDNSFLLKNIPIVNTTFMISQVMVWMLITINVVAIFLYKNRKTQMNLCILTAVLLVLLNLMGLFLINKIKLEESYLVYYKIASIFPLIGAILSYLAFRGIKKDDQLVKSYDRLR